MQRYGAEVIAVDSYANAPAMQVADRAHVVSMLDGAALRAVIEAERPHLIVPEVEAIATDTLAEPDTQIRLFGKPKVAGKRRMGVALARGTDIGKAREKARHAIAAIKVTL